MATQWHFSTVSFSFHYDRKRPQISLSLLHKLHCQWMCKLFPLCFMFRICARFECSCQRAFDAHVCVCVCGCNFQDAMTTFGSFHTLSATSSLNAFVETKSKTYFLFAHSNKKTKRAKNSTRNAPESDSVNPAYILYIVAHNISFCL